MDQFDVIVLATTALVYITGWFVGYYTKAYVESQRAKVTAKDLRPRD